MIARAGKGVRTLIGFGMLAGLVVSKGSYFGRSAFYRRIHDDTFTGRCVRAFLENSLLAKLYADYAYYSKHRHADRIPDHVLRLYSGTSLSGYADRRYAKGGEELSQQTRGLPLDRIRVVLDQLRSQGAATVVEIGTTNGDVLKHLAADYPELDFVGVDLNVDNARAYNGAPNITYVGGYAYDVLERFREERRRVDFLFAISTFTCTTPPEFVNYMQVIRSLQVRHLLISGANVNGYRQIESAPSFSRHMEGHVWFHNYCGYLRQFDYQIRHFEQFHFRHPRSDTPDIYWHHIHGELTH